MGVLGDVFYSSPFFLVKKALFPSKPALNQIVMKAFFSTFLLVVLVSSGFLSAATCYDASNSRMGSIENDGVVRSKDNSLMGKFGGDGSVRNRNNSLVGRVGGDGTVRDRHNTRIGQIEGDGTVRDGNNTRIGKVESDGTVRDRHNSRIGVASGVGVVEAALFYFFFDEMNK